MTMTIIPEEDQTILGLVTHGKAKELDQSIYKPDWLKSDVTRRLVGAGIELARQEKDITPISIIAKAKLSVPGLIPEMIEFFQNGFGKADVSDAVEHAYQDYACRQADQMADEIKRLVKTDPHGINKWMGRMGMGMASIMQSGDNYDSRPSHHAEQPLPTVFTKSLIGGVGPNNHMNDLLRGGYKTAFLLIYAGVTSHGKSVTLRSHAIDLILQKYKVAVVITENTEASFSAEVAAAMAGVDFEKEVSTRKFEGTAMQTAAEREARYRQCLQYCDEYLMVYGPSWYSDQQLERIERWNHPNALIIDYFMKRTGMLRKTNNAQDEVGDFADWMLGFAKSTGLWIGSAGQMSKDAAKKFLKSGATDDVILYGTARVEYASDEFGAIRRHPKLKNTAQFKIKKDRLGGKLDTVHDIPIDAKRRILHIQKLANQDLLLDDDYVAPAPE